MSFWGENPSVLWEQPYMLPSTSLTPVENFNALTRLLIVLTLIGFLFTFSIRYLLAGFVSLSIVYLYYYYWSCKNKESFVGQIPLKSNSTNPKTSLKDFVEDHYQPIVPQNPFQNVLVSDYSKPVDVSAAPSFNPEMVHDIEKATQKSIERENPGLSAEEMFMGLDQKMEFENSMMQFYSTPSTTNPNDQAAFAEYLYGTMPSCRGGDAIQCYKNNERYLNP